MSGQTMTGRLMAAAWENPAEGWAVPAKARTAGFQVISPHRKRSEHVNAGIRAQYAVVQPRALADGANHGAHHCGGRWIGDGSRDGRRIYLGKTGGGKRKQHAAARGGG